MRLIPEFEPLVVERHPLPNLLSINFEIIGLLGAGAPAGALATFAPPHDGTDQVPTH